MQQFLYDIDLDNGLTQDDYADFDKFVGIYESKVEKRPGYFNWDDLNFKNFCKMNHIQQKGTQAKKVQNNHFWFCADQPADVTPKDIAHNFLRHIRNAFSHGRITVYRGKHNRKYYIIQDFTLKGNKNMSGNIRSDLLWGMIERLLNSSKNTK